MLHVFPTVFQEKRPVLVVLDANDDLGPFGQQGEQAGRMRPEPLQSRFSPINQHIIDELSDGFGSGIGVCGRGSGGMTLCG